MFERLLDGHVEIAIRPLGSKVLSAVGEKGGGGGRGRVNLDFCFVYFILMITMYMCLYAIIIVSSEPLTITSNLA